LQYSHIDATRIQIGRCSELESWQIFHYRDKDQVEVDFVLEGADRQLIGIEVKAAATITRDDFRGLKKLHTITGARFTSGIVLYDGD
jgi:predicted AAA+ superfamily ATPase